MPKISYFLQSYNFIPTIDKPTRVHNNSATLIDNIFVNIFVNTIENDISSGNIVSDISDHFSQFCIVTLNNRSVQYSQGHKNLTTDYSKFSEANFIDKLINMHL
jgi:hypothetical protein